MESISQETVLAPIPQQGSTCYPTGERSCSRPLQHMCRCLRLFLCCMLWRGMNSAAAHRRNADRPSSSRNILSQAKKPKRLKALCFLQHSRTSICTWSSDYGGVIYQHYVDALSRSRPSLQCNSSQLYILKYSNTVIKPGQMHEHGSQACHQNNETL